MTAPLLCIAPTCRARDRHATDCPGECGGCLPRRAADGLMLCWPHAQWIGSDARAAADLHGELALALTGSGEQSGRVSGSPDRTRVPNPAAVEARTLIRHTLTSWCRLIAEERGIGLPTKRVIEELPPGFIGPPRLLTVPDDTVHAMGGYIALHAQWLAAHPAAGECSDELRELAHGRPRRVAYPDGTRTITVGPCPHEGCGGEVRAVLRRVDSLLPSSIVCAEDAGHTWQPSQWMALGRILGRRAA